MSTIENKLSTVTVETQLMQLFTAYEARTKVGKWEVDFFGANAWNVEEGDITEVGEFHSNHLREAASIALHALFDLGRTRRAHFWAAKFDMEWDDNEDLYKRVVALADMSGIEDGDIYDFRTHAQRATTI
jgi:hypothetical protein